MAISLMAPRIEGETIVAEEALVHRRGYANGPERALMSALLFDGVQAYLSHQFATSPKQKLRYREAYLWVHGEERDYVFSFDSCCEALGVDAGSLRLGLQNASNSDGAPWRKSRRTS